MTRPNPAASPLVRAGSGWFGEVRFVDLAVPFDRAMPQAKALLDLARQEADPLAVRDELFRLLMGKIVYAINNLRR